MAIDIGLYFDLRNPEPWRQDPARLHAFTLEMCEEAEHLGAGSLWFTEHHLFDDGYCSQPLTFAAAAAARTSRVRLGTAIVIAPLHHPAQIAEQAALVDLISNGRLELGLGAGYRAPEYELYDVSLEQRYAQTDDRAREIRRLLGTGGVTPSPVQNPLPVWMGYQGPQGARRAGLLGSGLLSANAALYEPYRQGLVDGGHDPASARMAGESKVGSARIRSGIGRSYRGTSPISSTLTAGTWWREPMRRCRSPSTRNRSGPVTVREDRSIDSATAPLKRSRPTSLSSRPARPSRRSSSGLPSPGCPRTW